MLAGLCIGLRGLQVCLPTYPPTYLLYTYTYLSPLSKPPNQLILFANKQILFGAVIVGLSAQFITAQKVGSAATTTQYSVFTGAYAIL